MGAVFFVAQKALALIVREWFVKCILQNVALVFLLVACSLSVALRPLLLFALSFVYSQPQRSLEQKNQFLSCFFKQKNLFF